MFEKLYARPQTIEKYRAAEPVNDIETPLFMI